MRPRFLGDQTPTAQFLNDITQVLSLKLTCVRVLLLTKVVCARIVSSSLGEDAREEKENADAPPPKPPPLTLKDLTDETTSRETIEICTSLIETIVRGAVRYELDANELRNELEQLGLPKEHTDAIAIPYGENKDKLRECMLKKVIRIGRDEEGNDYGKVGCSWEIVARAVDTTRTKKEEGEDLTAPDLRVKVSIGGCAFTADEIDLRVCINEMKSARAAMNE
ncbi:unnamed protein product [Bathycoccus prasinos]|uniref:COMM domain-containing protein, putative n=1 Tax=Bathycoccus prasinos TaxID=41875 RepID=K8EJC4_9CHLO|nr:COMM domain-containing protein, putative [Bathycoccus prasinos]CCO18131.1 COMM domain-containing protein, putative [Bathycoccus prasinos]|eukprot:XP_007510598.1 COMM domain-containing protein, putative [Bathycoccus prasinos]